MEAKVNVRGRFAPSPSGRMHLGNVCAALLSWLSVRSQQGDWLLRIEDLDPRRSRREYAEWIQSDLQWLGLDWDEEPVWQSERTSIYEAKLDQLQRQNLIYPCFCSRADLHSASAPHGTDGELLYSGRCRNLSEEQRLAQAKIRRPALRISVNKAPISFTDGLQGQIIQNLDQTCGDFIVRRSDGVFAYQLAVVVDDGLMGMTEVVRGLDLLSSTPRQLYLYRCLGLPEPKFYHIPLLMNVQGQRLSKRDQALDLGELRRRWSAPELIGKLAWLLGLRESEEAIEAKALIHDFDWTKVKRQPIFVPETLFIRSYKIG